MTKTEFCALIAQAGRLCDNLLTNHPIDERLHSARAVLEEAHTFAKRYWPDNFSQEDILVDGSQDGLTTIQHRLTGVLKLLNSFVVEMRHQTHINSKT